MWDLIQDHGSYHDYLRSLDDLEYAGRREELGHQFKKTSPGSSLFRVKVYNQHGMAQRNGTGMFPREVMNRFPLLPLEEEGRLNDMPLCENFVERVFACRRWTEMLHQEPAPGGLVKFHTVLKLTLMARLASVGPASGLNA
jgi:hypothetical protein